MRLQVRTDRDQRAGRRPYFYRIKERGGEAVFLKDQEVCSRVDLVTWHPAGQVVGGCNDDMMDKLALCSIGLAAPIIYTFCWLKKYQN